MEPTLVTTQTKWFTDQAQRETGFPVKHLMISLDMLCLALAGIFVLIFVVLTAFLVSFCSTVTSMEKSGILTGLCRF